MMHLSMRNDASFHEKYNMTCDTFVFDSGATSHMRFSKDGMVNLKPLKIDIKVGIAEDIYSEVIGTFKGLVAQKMVTHSLLHLKVCYIFLIYM
jgi:hypothetical protein